LLAEEEAKLAALLTNPRSTSAAEDVWSHGRQCGVHLAPLSGFRFDPPAKSAAAGEDRGRRARASHRNR
jgi:hypothetical protein